MTTEPADTTTARNAAISSEVDAASRRLQDERAEVSQRSRGDGDDHVRSLDLEPANLLERLVTSGGRALRVHNGPATARLAVDRSAWRLEAGDRIELEAPAGRARLEPADWTNLYLDESTPSLEAYDRSGRTATTIELESWCSVPDRDAPKWLDRSAPPSERSPDEEPELEVHETTFDEARFADAWDASDSFAETRRLERAARIPRGELLRRFPESTARGLSSAQTADIFGALPNHDGPVGVVLEGAGHRVSLTSDDLRAGATGAVLVGTGRQAQFVLDRRRLGGAFRVELGGNGNSRTRWALELVDRTGGFLGRIHRPAPATSHQVIDWRAALTGGSRG